MINRSIIQFLILYIYIFFECHYFVLNFILILCHLQFTGYKDRIRIDRIESNPGPEGVIPAIISRYAIGI